MLYVWEGMARRRPSIPKRLSETTMVAFRAPLELGRLLETLPNKSEFIRSAIEAQLDQVCPTCHGSGRVRLVHPAAGGERRG